MVDVQDAAHVAATRRLFRQLRGMVPGTDDELHEWLVKFLGVRFPKHAVSGNDSTAPFRPIADAFFMRETGILSLACRGGMKTLGVGATITAVSHFFPQSDIVSVGAIKEQAGRAHSYVQGFLDREWSLVHPVFADEDPLHIPDKGRVFGYPRGPLVQEILTEKIRFKNASVLQILPGTIRAVSGPHPSMAFFDEVDLAASWAVFQKWWGMPVSKGLIPEPIKTSYVKSRLLGHETPAEVARIMAETVRPAQRIITSTRETMSGIMDRLITDSSKMGLNVYKWNIYDTMQSCKARFGGCLCKRGGGQIDNTACPLWDAGCGGIAENADGSKIWEDVVDSWKGTDDETWETQFLCTRPSRKGLVFPQFEPMAPYVTDDADYHPRKGFISMGIDVGYTDPYVVLLGQRTPHSIDIFDELWCTQRQTDDMKYMVTSGEWPQDALNPDSLRIRDYFQYQDTPYGKMAANMEYGYMDPHYPGDRQEWCSNQIYHVGNSTVVLPTFNIKKCDAGIKDRLAVLRRRFRTFTGPDGKPWAGLRIHPRCAKLIWELSVGYRYRIDSTTQDVVGDVPQDANNHGVDALGYMGFEMDRPRPQIRLA